MTLPAERRGTLNGIERATFSEMETDDKLNVLYDYHVSMHNLIYRMFSENCPRQAASCSKRMEVIEDKNDKRDIRLEKIEKSRLWNTAASAVGGVIGGAAAIMAKIFFTGDLK